MKNTFDQMKLYFLGALVLSCAVIWGYKVFYVWPRERCEAAGDWWNAQDHECDTPVAIWKLTGRRVGPAAAFKQAPAASKIH